MKRSVNEYDENRGGGVGTSMLKEAALATGTAAGLYGVGKADREMTKRGDERREKEQREAASEMKRESRDIPKPANFDAIEESKQDAKDAAARKKISDMGHKKGGMISSASSRADGCCAKGKTRGKIV
jgi:hypothetical protein